MRIFISGPLFSECERKYNIELKKEIEKLGHTVVLPQEITKIDDSLSDIFLKIPKEIQKSDLIIGVLEGADIDSGTAWEIGYAYSLNKKIIGIRTDFRTLGDKEGIMNMMITGSLFGLAFSIFELNKKISECD